MLQAINNPNVIITVAGILYVQNKRVKYELKHYTTAVTDNQDESFGVTERGQRKGGFVVGKVRFRRVLPSVAGKRQLCLHPPFPTVRACLFH